MVDLLPGVRVRGLTSARSGNATPEASMCGISAGWQPLQASHRCLMTEGSLVGFRVWGLGPRTRTRSQRTTGHREPHMGMQDWKSSRRSGEKCPRAEQISTSRALMSLRAHTQTPSQGLPLLIRTVRCASLQKNGPWQIQGKCGVKGLRLACRGFLPKPLGS